MDWKRRIRGRLQSLITRIFTSRIGRETLSSVGLRIASTGLTFLSVVLLARVLGPAEYGVYSYVYALISLLAVPSEFGLPILVVRETARGMAREDYATVQGIWRWAGWLTIVISLGLISLTGIAIWFFKEPLAGRRLETFLWALMLVPLIALGNLRGAALRGLQKVFAGQLPEFLFRPGLLVLLLGGVIFLGSGSLTAPQAMLLYTIASALAFGAGAWLLWRTIPIKVHSSVPRFESRTWLLSAVPLAFIGGMQLINQQASILLQGFFITDAEIGIFRVAIQVSQLASFGLVAINMVVAPRFAALHTQGNKAQMQRLVTTSARVILIFTLLITTVFVVLGQPFLRLFFGPEYETAYLSLIILMAGQLINSGMGSVGVLLNMTGYEQETAKGMVLAAFLNITLNLLLIPVWGIVGSSLASSISLMVWNVILWQAVWKKLGINSLAFG
ncbi:MAG: oligosaccharide flippase family protein [Anaerolineales bacterium]|nr:oligosaccharide flippase family protein [Anaerolineales bacterium]